MTLRASSRPGARLFWWVPLLLATAAAGCAEDTAGQDIDASDAATAEVSAGVDAVADAGPEVTMATLPALPGPGGATCGAAPLAHAGALCGGGGPSCAILARETLVTGDGAGGRVPRSPSLALDRAGRPGVFTVATPFADPGSASPYLLFERTAAATWTESTVASVAWATESWSAIGGLVYYADGPAVLVTREMFDVELHARSATGWALRDTLSVKTPFGGRNVRRDAGGCLHALSDPAGSAAVASTPLVTSLRWDGTTHATGLGGDMQFPHAAFALAPDGTPLAAWYEGERPANVFWSDGQATPEVAFAEPHEALGGVLEAALGADAAGAPHLLVRKVALAGTGETTSLWHATRGAGAWTSTPIGSAAEMPGCTGQEPCTVEGDGVTPLAVVTSGDGSVRLLWTRFHDVKTEGQVCSSPNSCTRQTTARHRVGSLMMAAPGGPAVAIATDLALEEAMAVVDAAGRIHVVGLDGSADWGPGDPVFIPPLVYVLIGSAP